MIDRVTTDTRRGDRIKKNDYCARRERSSDVKLTKSHNVIPDGGDVDIQRERPMEFQCILWRMAVPMVSICFIVGLGGCDFTPLDIPKDDPQRDVALQQGASDSLTINNVVVRSGRSYTVHPNLQVGDPRYMDRDFAFTEIPPALVGQTYVRTANDDRTSYPFDTNLFSFDANVDVDVYVADSDRTKRPGWLEGWTDTGLNLRDNNNRETKYSLLTKRYPSGKITLGSNYWGDGANMYTVVIVPVADSAGETAIDSTTSGLTTSRTVPAFPGAEGFGATALQRCRALPLEVLEVSNLEDSGPGSLRDVIESASNDRFSIVVFRVGGYITLHRRLQAEDRHCLYVAGQTAPGDGITIRGYNGIRFHGTNEDVVLRHFRVRLGAGGQSGGTIAVYINEGNRVVLDHLSTSWASEKLIVVSAQAPDSVVNISVQRTLLAEVLADHPTAMQLTGEPRNNPPNRDISIHRNMLAHNGYRNPQLGTWNVQFVNNIVYNWLQGASQTGGPDNVSHGDFVNNYYKPGPMTDERYLYEITVDCGTKPGYVSVYAAGNVGPHNRDPSASSREQWTTQRVTACYYQSGPHVGASVPLRLDPQRNSRLETPALFPPIERSALEAELDVAADVGANAMVTCTGAIVQRQDAVDLRILNEYALGTGVGRPPASEAAVGGFPNLSAGSPCVDSDADGLPDEWELRYPAARNPSGDDDRDGYLNIEEFLNGTEPSQD